MEATMTFLRAQIKPRARPKTPRGPQPRNASDNGSLIDHCPRRQEGAALVEFALVVPILLVLVFGIIDFGLYFYNDLVLTQVARDAARYASVGNVAEANVAIGKATLVSTTITAQTVNAASPGQEASVVLTAIYTALTPLPGLVGIGNTLNINATARMRRE